MYGYSFNAGFKLSGGGVVPFDPDAQAFITAASITDPTQQSAVNQLVLDLKTANIWTKMKAVYPFVGGTATAHKWNLKDPRDLDAAFRLVFSGGWTHDQFGANPNGSNCIGNTFLNPSTTLSNTSTHISYYGREAIGDLPLSDMGVGGSGLFISMYINYLGVGYYDQNNQTTGRLSYSMSGISTQGFFMSTRTSNIVQKAFKNAVQQGVTNTQTMTSLLPNDYFYIGAQNIISGTPIFGANQCLFASIGDGLTDTESANLYTAVQAFQTTLSRQV